jgi:hypothetical protein
MDTFGSFLCGIIPFYLIIETLSLNFVNLTQNTWIVMWILIALIAHTVASILQDNYQLR